MNARLLLLVALSLGCTDAGLCEEDLNCTDDIETECDGLRTEVVVPMPSGCTGQTLTDDIPEDGFPLGETAIHFSTTHGEQQCSLGVRVVDTTPPTLNCSETTHLALVNTSEIPSIPQPEWSDRCDMGPVLTTSPDTLDIGWNTVRFTATDGSGNETSCSTDIEVQELYPVEELQVLSASRTAEDGTQVQLGWSPATGEATTALRLESSASRDGPWTTESTLPDDSVSTDTVVASGEPIWFRLTSMSEELDGASSEPIRVWPISATQYDERGITIDRVPFPTTLYGVVRYPTSLDQGPFPLVLLLHGNHGNCRPSPDSVEDSCATSLDHECPWEGWSTTPNAEGMLFQAETLAAQGYIAVSISGNAMNCREDYILERAELVIEHLRHWRNWNETDGGPLGSDFEAALDLSRIGLVGHSRGGDAVSHVPTLLQANPEDGITVESVFSIAPTDFHDAEVRDTHYATLLPACDGDVASLSGREIYDRSVRDDNPVLQAQALYMGANHNFFSTEWAYNDGNWVCSDEELVGKHAQRSWLESTLGPWFHGTLGSVALRPDIRAEGPLPPAVESWAGQSLDVRWSFSSDDRLPIDDMEGPEAPDINLLGEPNVFIDFQSTRHCESNTCGHAFDHQRSALVLRWTAEDNARASFGLGDSDLREFPYLSFRLSSRSEGWNDGREWHDAWLTIEDTDGDRATVRLSEIRPIPHGYAASHETDILQTVRLDLTALSLDHPELDLDSIESFEMELPGDEQRGSLYMTDLELAH